MTSGPENELTNLLRGVTEPYVVMGVGIPRTGKTKELRRLGSELDIQVLSPFVIGNELFRAGLLGPGVVSRVLTERIEELLAKGQPVAVDSTHIDALSLTEKQLPKTRGKLTERYRGFGAKAAMAIVFDHPLEEALRGYTAETRGYSKNAIRGMHFHIHERPVSLQEGFDVIATQKGRDQPIRITAIKTSDE